MNQKASKPKASEKLKALESSLMATMRRTGEMEMIIFNLSRENEILKDALQLLHDKQEAVLSLLRDGSPLTDENINNKVTDLKVLALEDKVQQGIDSGNLAEASEIGQESLVVGRELNEKGEVENPRLQFMMGRLNVPELKEKFIGKKVGDLISNGDDTLDIEIMEIYDFVEQELASDVIQTSEGEVNAEDVEIVEPTSKASERIYNADGLQGEDESTE